MPFMLSMALLGHLWSSLSILQIWKLESKTRSAEIWTLVAENFESLDFCYGSSRMRSEPPRAQQKEGSRATFSDFASGICEDLEHLSQNFGGGSKRLPAAAAGAPPTSPVKSVKSVKGPIQFN